MPSISPAGWYSSPPSLLQSCSDPCKMSCFLTLRSWKDARGSSVEGGGHKWLIVRRRQKPPYTHTSQTWCRVRTSPSLPHQEDAFMNRLLGGGAVLVDLCCLTLCHIKNGMQRLVTDVNTVNTSNFPQYHYGIVLVPCVSSQKDRHEKPRTSLI